ncbi:stage II sporulation protein P [Cytobacillus purgationiresistens]|uniref:Stage II sporulation protein P n=1 Tax=Cytobacillus purgationiresistens TaxID=863449 RepID=A0ABU0AE33_9BACI|nr:stage II sporulation protein P [Cytobacillus purgationiresistens]MDQ0269515.1 stage II sporulation protein P [Cytobacillus purgationiresistens]
MKTLKQSGLLIEVQWTSLVKGLIGFLLFLFMIFSISGALTTLKPEYRISSSSVNTAAKSMTGDMLYKLFGWENHYFLQSIEEKTEAPSVVSALFQLSTNISFDDPRSLFGRELPALTIFDSEIIVAGEGTDYTNMPIESSPTLEVLQANEQAVNTAEVKNEPSDTNKEQTPAMTTGDKKVAYIYFTHNTEAYLPYLKGVDNPDGAYHPEMNVTKIGDKLQEALEGKGIGTVVEKTDVQANLSKKGLTYGYSYQESRKVVEAAVSSQRDLTYLIDIHRDSKRKEATTKKLDGKNYAKLAFVVGGEHVNYEKNLQFANELHQRLQKKYKGVSRGSFTKEGKGTNGKFNQDLSDKAILIEFGGLDNTYEELDRSAEALAEVISEYYWQAEEVNQSAEQKADKE